MPAADMSSDRQPRQFEEHGYLVVDNVADRKTVLEPVIEEYEQLPGELGNRWTAEGRLDPDARACLSGEPTVTLHRRAPHAAHCA